MKRIIMLAALVASSFAVGAPLANQDWVLRKIDETVGTNTAATIVKSIEDAGGTTPALVTNIAADVVTRSVPAWALSSNPPFLRTDKTINDNQDFRGTINIDGGIWIASSLSAQANGWMGYMARNGNNLAQSLPDYIASNPWGFALSTDVYTKAETAEAVTEVVRSVNAGVWDEALEVWWTPVMVNGQLTYQATTNVNLNAEN